MSKMHLGQGALQVVNRRRCVSSEKPVMVNRSELYLRLAVCIVPVVDQCQQQPDTILGRLI